MTKEDEDDKSRIARERKELAAMITRASRSKTRPATKRALAELALCKNMSDFKLISARRYPE